jgi:oligopeptide/dipeptide ABC transporter ATP-binding protein
MSDELLRLDGVRKYFGLRGVPWRAAQMVKAVDGVSLVVRKGETVGLVGESGSGKSTLARVATRLLDPTSGRVEIGGKDVTRFRGRRLRPIRRTVQMVFQDPQASLNPRQSVGTILSTPFRAQGTRPTRAQLIELLQKVGLSAEHLERYPHEFSGGQRQRIGIARALAVSPDLLICDEPVSALDVSVQAQVLNLLADLRDELGLSYVVVAHDLAVVRQVASRVAVMYLGTIVEEGPADQVYASPAHPYTKALLSAVPVPEPGVTRDRIVLTGDVPTPIAPPSGCPFRTRCYKAEDICATDRPVLEVVQGQTEHKAACYFPEPPPPERTR